MSSSESSQTNGHIPSAVSGHVQSESCRQRLNPQGKAIIEDFLDKNIKIGTSITLELRKAVVQQVVDAGNSKFKMNNILYYITKRQGEYLESYATDTGNKETRQLDSNEKEPPYHLISKNARKNVRWLIQEAKLHPNSWARKYIDKVHLAISYVDYIDAGGEDTFDASSKIDVLSKDSDSDEPSELPPQAKESATKEQEQMRAERVEVRLNGTGGSRASIMNEDGRIDQTRVVACSHLPPPVSPSPKPEGPTQSQPQLMAQRPSSAILIRTDRSHTNRVHTPYPQLRKHATSAEARAVVNNAAVKQEPQTPNEPFVFQHPLSPTPSAPGVSPVIDHAPPSPSPTTESQDVQHTRAASVPPPESNRERASSTGHGHIESTQGRQQNGSATSIPAAPAQENAASALQRSSLETDVKEKLLAIANFIDDFKTGLEGIRKVHREQTEEFVRAGGRLGKQAMDELSNIDINALLAEVIAGSRSGRSPIDPSIALDVQHVDDVQGSMDINLEPAPTCFQTLLEWIDKYQVQLDMIISFGQQIKAAKAARSGH